MDIGIDLGTANIMISIRGKGVVFYEPAVVAYNKKTEDIMAVGTEAYKMIGKAPDYIAVIRPLCDGVISDYDMTETLVRECIRRVTGRQERRRYILSRSLWRRLWAQVRISRKQGDEWWWISAAELPISPCFP